MVGVRSLSLMLMMFAIPIVASACDDWQQMPYGALRLLAVCDEPPVQRKLGNLCVRHEWLCGKTTFKAWFDQWMAQTDELIIVEQRIGQLVFSGVYQHTAWALFWAPIEEEKNGFVVLLSRLKTAPTMEKQ